MCSGMLPGSGFDRSKSKARNRGGLQNRSGRGGNNQGQGRGDGPTGLRIAGVKSLCEEEPFRVYRNQSEYKMWLFTYLDLEQRRGQTSSPENPNLTPPNE